MTKSTHTGGDYANGWFCDCCNHHEGAHANVPRFHCAACGVDFCDNCGPAVTTSRGTVLQTRKIGDAIPAQLGAPTDPIDFASGTFDGLTLKTTDAEYGGTETCECKVKVISTVAAAANSANAPLQPGGFGFGFSAPRTSTSTEKVVMEAGRWYAGGDAGTFSAERVDARQVASLQEWQHWHAQMVAQVSHRSQHVEHTSQQMGSTRSTAYGSGILNLAAHYAHSKLAQNGARAA